MRPQSSTSNDLFTVMTRDWRRLFGLILPFSLVFGGLLTLENVAVAKIDVWLSVDSFEVAARYSLYVSAAALWFRLCVIGVCIAVVFKAFGEGGRTALPTQFLNHWFIVCLVFTLSLLVIDLLTHGIQFGTIAMDGAGVRWFWLATLYARLALFYIASRLLIGVLYESSPGRNRWAAAWSATTTLQSLGFFLALLVTKLFVDGVIIDLVSYVPLVSPFWFIPNELSPLRYFVGQGIQIVAQSCGVFLYVAFWIVADSVIRASHERKTADC